jgi:hypothetical protein
MAIVNIYYPIDLNPTGMYGNNAQTIEETAVVQFDSVPDNPIDAIVQANFFTGMPHRALANLAIEEDSLKSEVYDDYGLYWAISATYSTQGATFNESDEEDLYRPVIKPYTWTYQKVVTHDKVSGDPIENPAGDPPENPFVRNVPNVGWRITLRETSANMNRCFNVGDINSGAFTMLGLIVPAHCAQLVGYDPDPQYDANGNYFSLNTYDVRWNFALANDGTRIGFKEETLASGYNELKTASDKTSGTRRLVGDDLQPISTPAKIGADGKLTTTAYYQQWVVDDITDFSGFGLPTTYPSFQNG